MSQTARRNRRCARPAREPCDGVRLQAPAAPVGAGRRCDLARRAAPTHRRRGVPERGEHPTRALRVAARRRRRRDQRRRVRRARGRAPGPSRRDPRPTRAGGRRMNDGREETDIGKLIIRAKAQLEALTGRPVNGVVAVEPEDGVWRVTLELVELERIPASTNVIGRYELVVDDDGGLREFARTQRYYNNRADEDDGY